MDEKQKEEQERLCKAYFSTFHSMEGQIVLKNLLNLFYRNTSLNPDGNPNFTLINEGKRFVVIHILSMMEVVSNQPEDQPEGSLR